MVVVNKAIYCWEVDRRGDQAAGQRVNNSRVLHIHTSVVLRFTQA